jgi:hypothetical protein
MATDQPGDQSTIRLEAVRRVVEIEGSLGAAIEALHAFPWDWNGQRVKFTADHLRNAIAAFSGGSISENELIAWADALEVRDDVEASGSTEAEKELLQDALFRISTPELNAMLMAQTVQDILKQLNDLCAEDT